MHAAEPARRHALRRWQRAAGPFAPLVSPTPLLARTDVNATGPVPGPPPWAADLAAALRDEAAFGRTLAMVDRPAVEALAAAPVLLRHRTAVAPVMRRWPFPDGLLPAAPLLDALLTLAPLLRSPGRWRAAVLLAEAERLTPVAPAADPDAPPDALRGSLDNRYDLDALDLPPALWLRAVGIERVLSVVPAGGDVALPAPDVALWLRGLAAAGLPTGLLPLALDTGANAHPR